LLGERTKDILIVIGSTLGWVPLIGFEMVFPLLIFITKDVKKVRKWIFINSTVFGGITSLGWMTFIFSVFSKPFCVYLFFCATIFAFVSYWAFGVWGEAWLKIYSEYSHSISKRSFLVKYIRIKLVASLKILLFAGLCFLIFLLPLRTEIVNPKNEKIVEEIDQIVNDALKWIEATHSSPGGHSGFLTLLILIGLLLFVIFQLVISILLPILWAWEFCKIGKRIDHALGERTTI